MICCWSPTQFPNCFDCTNEIFRDITTSICTNTFQKLPKLFQASIKGMNFMDIFWRVDCTNPRIRGRWPLPAIEQITHAIQKSPHFTPSK
jgi:hypothetical protein